MRNLKKLLGVGAAAMVLGLGGCAPMMNGIGFNAYSSCSGPARFSASSRTPSVLRTQNRMAAVQSRFQLGARYAPSGARMGGDLARGECR